MGAHAGKPPRIVVIDDDEPTRALLAEALAERGDVRTCATAAEGMAVLTASDGAALVLLDVQLPDADGLALLRDWRARWPGTKVVMLTGRVCVPSAVQAIQDGASDYLTKPVDVERLHAVVSRALDEVAGPGAAPAFVLPPEGVDLAQVEQSFVEQALERAGGNRTRAGRLLGINRDQVRYRIKRGGGSGEGR